MDEIEQELKKLIGSKVVNVIFFDNGRFREGFILEFDNGMYLTAQDDEYGDNSFAFLTEEEVAQKIALTERRLG
jgi:hypothetical protein